MSASGNLQTSAVESWQRAWGDGWIGTAGIRGDVRVEMLQLSLPRLRGLCHATLKRWLLIDRGISRWGSRYLIVPRRKKERKKGESQ